MPKTVEPPEFPDDNGAFEPPEERAEEADIEVIDVTPAAVVPYVIPEQQHLVVGVGALAALPEEVFNANLQKLVDGQKRLQLLTDKLLIEKQDYGKVPGISKPFLQKPGAEKLANFYGLAVRFEAERLVGDGKSSPDLAYHVRSYAHLGDFSGPIVAMGYGEANTWEERYRYREAKPTCTKCGREGLVRRKSPPELEGKWSCPSWKGLGGCNAVYEPSDPAVANTGKIENPDPWGLANTLVKMGEKRAHVDVILRATGTSGFFTQDEDSPSVRQQAEGGPPEPEEIKIETVKGEVARGAKTSAPSAEQFKAIKKIAADRDITPVAWAALLKRLFDLDVAETNKAVSDGIKGLTADQVGQLIHAAETGEVPE